MQQFLHEERELGRLVSRYSGVMGAISQIGLLSYGFRCLHCINPVFIRYYE